MRKLNVLKSIIDLLWILTMITIPVLLFFGGYLLTTNEPLDIPIKINGIEINIIDIKTKILFIFLLLAYGLLIYALFLFKTVMRYFQKRKIFDIIVIKNLNKIGISLSVAALLFGIPGFIINLINKELKLEIGINSFVLLFALGLFFMVLSEVFKVAKNMKEENELTV